MSARRHEPRSRGCGSYRRVLDLWLDPDSLGRTRRIGGGSMGSMHIVKAFRWYVPIPSFVDSTSATEISSELEAAEGRRSAFVLDDSCTKPASGKTHRT